MSLSSSSYGYTPDELEPLELPVERVALYLAGCANSASIDAITDYIRRKTGGFAPHIVTLEPQRVGKATLEGPGALAAAARIEGKQADVNGCAFKACSLANAWYCPCGRSGADALAFAAACSSCGMLRPKSIAAAAAAVPRVPPLPPPPQAPPPPPPPLRSPHLR